MVAMNIIALSQAFDVIGEDYIDRMLSLCRSDYIDLPLGCLYELDYWDINLVIKTFGIRPDDTVLHVGGLYGFQALYFADFCQSVKVIDNYQILAMPYNNGRMSPRDWENYVNNKSNGRVEAQFGHLTNIQYPNESFSKIICTKILERTALGEKCVAEMLRVLKPGGEIYVTTSFHDTDSIFYMPEIQFRVFDLSGLHSLFKDLPLLDYTTDREAVPVSDPWPRYKRIAFRVKKPQ
jgi:SAM-dependent methyltransferase